MSLDRVRRFFIVCVALASLLTGCVGYPRWVNYPLDPAGQSLNSPAEEIAPQVNSRYLVFTSDRRGSQDIYLYDRAERRLVDLPGLNSLDTIASHPSITEDGNYIIFSASRQGKSGIYLYNRETRQLRNLTADLPAAVRNPTISADGNTIAFESSANGQWDILLRDRTGRPLKVSIEPPVDRGSATPESDSISGTIRNP